MPQYYQQTLLGMTAILLLATMPAYAVKVQKVSKVAGAVQVWFEGEDFDSRDPDGPQFYPITGEGNAPKVPKGAFGEAITRAGGAGGRVTWKFDISKAGGKKGEWYLWGRVINPSNHSDYLLVEGHDKKIPDTKPFPGGDGAPPFVNEDDRIFEATVAGDWQWDGGPREGHVKELQAGENVMHMFHRQGSASRFIDVFVWTDDRGYRPNDDDYKKADEVKLGQAVDPAGKLATAWGKLKRR